MGAAYQEFQSRLREMLPVLRAEYGVESLGLFGSYVSGSPRPDSDLDVLVAFSETPSLFRLIDLENLLSDTLGVRVDLVIRRALKPYIGERVLREVVRI